LALYRCKGVDGLRDAIGDWSVCIWDADRRVLVLASDYAGIRPLHYYRCGGAVYWSSSLSDLVRRTGSSELDEIYAANFLLHGPPPGRTPYAGIASVTPGHAVCISRDQMQVRTFWRAPVWGIRSSRAQDYEEQLIDPVQKAGRAGLTTGST